MNYQLYRKTNKKYRAWISENHDGDVWGFLRANKIRVTTFFPYSNTEDWSFRIKYPFGLGSSKNYVAGSRGEPMSYLTHDKADDAALNVAFKMMEEGL